MALMTEEDKMKEGKELYDYRVRLYRDAQSWIKPDRIPVNLNMFAWMFFDAGYTLGTASRNYDIIEECMIRCIHEYPCDQINVTNSGFRNTFLLQDALGSSHTYAQNTDQVNAIIEDVMLSDEYDEYVEDSNKLLWEKVLFRLYPAAKELNAEQFAMAAKTMLDYKNARKRIDDRMRNEFGILCDNMLTMTAVNENERSMQSLAPAIDTFFNWLRGLKGIAMDLRRCPDKLKEACDVIDESNYINMKANYEAIGYGHDMTTPYDSIGGMLAWTILNQKNFDIFYAPVFKRYLDLAQSMGKQIICWSEGSWARFGDFFNEWDRGTLNLMVEMDDPYELRKSFPNICITGGLDTTVIGHGTVQQCLDMTKKSIDELGRDGGLVLSPSKMITFHNDATPENLKAITNFALEYRW